MLTADEQKKYGCAVGFIGAWEKERSDSIIYLAENGIKVIILLEIYNLLFLTDLMVLNNH